MTVHLTWDELSLNGTISLLGVLYLVIVFFSGLLSLLYQVKSFRFYRKKEKQKLHKELPKILWIGALSMTVLLFYIAGVQIYATSKDAGLGSEEDTVFRVFLFLMLAILNVLEVLWLKKRIKRLKMQHDTKEEISYIGNQTL